MSILHDSLERHRRDTAATTTPTAPWSLPEPEAPRRSAHGLLTRRTRLLLGGLVLFSLGAWGIVQIWPMSEMPPGGMGAGNHPEVTSSSMSTASTTTEAAGAVREPIVQFVEVRDEPVSRPTASSPSPAPPRPHAPADVQSLAVSASDGVRDKPLDASPFILDQRVVHELNLRLSTLLAALDHTTDTSGGQASNAVPDQAKTMGADGEPGLDAFLPGEGHVTHPGGTPRGIVDGKAPELPEVHISVRTSASSDMTTVRVLEEELGLALRAGNWASFDMAYNQLASLRKGEILSRWQAARAMAQGDFEQARQLLEVLHRANPYDLQAGVNLTLVYKAQGRIVEARAIARNLANRHPLDPGLQAVLDRLESARAQ